MQPGSGRHRQQEPGIVLKPTLCDSGLAVAVSALLAADRNRNAFVLVLAADHGEDNSPRSLSKTSNCRPNPGVAEEPGEFRPLGSYLRFPCCCALRRRTLGPPPFPSMKPATSNSAKSLAMVIDVHTLRVFDRRRFLSRTPGWSAFVNSTPATSRACLITLSVDRRCSPLPASNKRMVATPTPAASASCC